MTSVILVEPQLGENIGATARAMKNFSVTDLRIVNPRDGWPNPKAVDTSVGAVDIINSAKIFPNILSSLIGVKTLYALTARTRYINKPHFYLHELENISSSSAFMFGRENSGLTNEEIALADAVVTIDTNPTFSSLNIAQSVILVCSKVFSTSRNNKHLKEENKCNKEHLGYFLELLIEMLDNKKFFKVQEKKERMVYNIKNIFSRHDISETELNTLIGIIKTLDS